MPRKKKNSWAAKRSRYRQAWLKLSPEAREARIAHLRESSTRAGKLKAYWAAMTPAERSEKTRKNWEGRRAREGEPGVPGVFLLRPEQLAWIRELAAREGVAQSVLVRSLLDEAMYIR